MGVVTELSGLVGRRLELAMVVDVLGGRGDHSVVVVAGDAGVGKSRLTAEAVAGAIGEGVTVLLGHCLPLTEQLPLLPIQRILRALGDLDDGILMRDLLAGYAPAVRDEIQRVAPGLVEGSVPAPEPGAGDGWYRRQLFDAVRQVLVDVSRQRRLAVVVEDMHWADPPTLDLLEYVLAPGAGPAVRLVVTCRTGEPAAPAVDAWLGWMRRQPGVRFEELAPLDLQETAAQVLGVLGQPLSADEVRQVFTRSEGNPLFTEQLVTFLHPDSGWSAGSRDAPLPTQLRDLLLARVAQVSGPASEVMSCLAVAGRPLDEAVLSSCCSVELPQVRDALKVLSGRRLLAAPDEAGAFRLRHALLAEAIRGALLPGELRDWHLRLATTLIAADELAQSAEIAEHFGAAGDIVSELPWRIRAGRRADEVYAFAQAVPQWLRAVELLEGLTSPGLPDSLPAHVVYTAACDALDNAGRGVEAGRVAERAVGHLLATADPAVAAELLMRVGHYRGIEDPQAGKAVLARAIGLYESLPPSPGYLRAVAYYTATVRVSEDMADAATLLDRALAVVDQVERPYDNGDLFNRRAWICLYQGDSRRALQLMEQSWRLSAPAPDPRPRVCHAASFTDILLKLGRLTDAVEVAERADLAGWTRSGRPETHDTATLRSNVFDALTMLGETEAAARRVEAFTTGAPTRDTVALHLDQAILALLRGDLSGAAARWAELDAVIVSGGEMGYESERWRVELELWQHRPDRAVQRALRALQGLAHTVYSPLSGPLLALAMRACADLSEHRSTSVLPAGEPLAARLHQVHDDMWQDPFLPGPVRVTHEADRLAWDAEQARARGDATPEAWDHVAAGYERVGRPHLVAYGRWRQAEALLADPVRKRDAAPVLRDAARLAIGHAPLLRQIKDLATRARIDLTPRQAPPPAATAPFGLTGRELAVLRLLGQGRSNAQVGAELFISTKTASVHVSNILRKMQVPTRVAAATVAAQSGLLEEPDSNSRARRPV